MDIRQAETTSKQAIFGFQFGLREFIVNIAILSTRDIEYDTSLIK